jgi:hypothetical protein
MGNGPVQLVGRGSDAWRAGRYPSAAITSSVVVTRATLRMA